MTTPGQAIPINKIPRTATSGPPTMIEVDGHRIAHRQVGTGPDVLFIHGWPLHGGTWRNIVPHLAEEFTCHVIDLPGTGDTTSTPGTRLALELNTDVVLQVIDALALERYAVVGNDSGGMVARGVAAARPEQVEAVVIAGSEIPGHVPRQIERLKILMRLPGIVAMTSLTLRNRWLRRSPLGLVDCFSDMAASDGDFAEIMLEPLRDRRTMDRQLELLRTFEPSQVDVMFDVHHKITAPTLMIWGDGDPYFPVAKAREMAPQFGGAVVFKVVDDAKLFVHEEHPARFAELTGSFLADTNTGAPDDARAAQR